MLNSPYEWVDSGDDFFSAKITSVAAGTGAQTGQYLYAWKEQVHNTQTGAFMDALDGRYGTVSANYALELNNQNLTSLPVYVKMRVLGAVGGNIAYIFLAPAVSPALTVETTGGGTVINNVSTIEIDSGLTLTNDSGKAKIAASGGGSLTVQNGATVIDAACQVLTSDSRSVVTFTHTGTNADQLTIADASATQAGVVNTSAQNWTGNKLVDGNSQLGSNGNPAGNPAIFIQGNTVVSGIGSYPTILGQNSSGAFVYLLFDPANGRIFPTHGTSGGGLWASALYAAVDSTGVLRDGIDATISYTKPGGATGIITVTKGIITNVT